MPNRFDKPAQAPTANDNLYRIKSVSSGPRTFDPLDFEELMDQRLSEGKPSEDPSTFHLICHVY
jgi:hypothetical protein